MNSQNIFTHRVLFLLPQLSLGGSEKVVLNLIQGLDSWKFKVYIGWFHGELHPPFSELKDIPFFYLDKQKKMDYKVIYKLIKIIRLNKIDVVNAHHFMPLIYAYPACKLTGCKLIYTEHSVFETNHSERLRKNIARFIFNTTDTIVGVSPEVTEAFKNNHNVKEKRLRTIVNGIDLREFKPAPKDSTFLESFGFSLDNIIIGMTGNFRAVKNHGLLVKAFAKIHADFPKTRLMLIGQGFSTDPENTESRVRQLVHDYGLNNKVVFLGYRADVHTILPNIDILCLTSFREGLPLSLIEGMACGIPVVGTDVPGNRVVISSGHNGILVESNNETDLASALNRLVVNPNLRKRMGNEARSHVERYYNINEFSRCYANLLYAFSYPIT